MLAPQEGSRWGFQALRPTENQWTPAWSHPTSRCGKRSVGIPAGRGRAQEVGPLRERHHGPEGIERVRHPPSPKWGRNPLPIPWTTFIHAHAESIVACDFFSKKVHTLRGTLTAYVLVFIHLGSRRVYCSPATYSPNGEWVMQQNRSASMWMEDESIAPRFILRDRDRKYPDGLKEFWRSSGATCLKSPPKAPKANAFAESFIGTLKRECLNYFVCFSRDQLNYIVRTWVKHYNTERPHRGVGIDNNVLDASFTPESAGAIRCRRQLGGIVTSYYRDAA